jgi:hypothetical protein
MMDMHLLESIPHNEFLYFENKTPSERMEMPKAVFTHSARMDLIRETPERIRATRIGCTRWYPRAIIHFSLPKDVHFPEPEGTMPKGLAPQMEKGKLSGMKVGAAMASPVKDEQMELKN